MIKIIDIDKLFDAYISDYVYSNIDKVKPEEIENKIPELYNEFGDTALKELDGQSPKTFYRSFSGNELIECLKEHIKKGVEVSDFLYEAIRDGDNEEDVFDALFSEEDEETILYLMNVMQEKNSKKGAKRYLEFIISDYSEPIRELATEILSENANEVKEQAIELIKDVSEDKKVYLVEILSKADKDDRILGILTEQLLAHKENYPLYANYIANYGDERALPVLYQLAESEEINYADYEEIRFAIESLGGFLDHERDFSRDKIYQKIKTSEKRN